MKTTKTSIIILVLILAGAVFLRSYKIGDKLVWYDEASSIAHAERSAVTNFSSFRVNFKPVYFFLLHQWMSLFGNGATVLRVFSVIWGILNIVIVYKLTRLMFDEKTGIFGAFLLSISVFHIFHCQQIRQFTLIAFLASLSVYFFIRYFKSSRLADLVVLTLANILIIHTYPTGYSMVFFEGLFALCYFRGELLRKWMVSQLVLAVFLCRFLLVVDKQLIGQLVWWIKKPGLSSIVETFNTFSWGGPRYGLDDLQAPLKWPWLAALLSMTCFIMVVRGCLKNRDKKPAVFLMLLWAVAPVAMLFISSHIYETSFYAIKHTIISLPAFCILVALGLTGLRRVWTTFILVFIFLLNLLPLSTMYGYHFAVDWKSSAYFLKTNIKKGDIVILSPLHEVIPFMYYFDARRGALKDIDMYGRITNDSYYNSVFTAGNNNLIIGIKESGWGDGSVSAEADFRKKFSDYSKAVNQKPTWTVLMRYTQPDTRALIFDSLQKDLRMTGCREFSGIEICRFGPANDL